MLDNTLGKSDPPTLLLGPIGFTPEAERTIARILERACNDHAAWRLTRFEASDAWWVNGAGLQLLEDGSIATARGPSGHPSVRFTAKEMDRPVAFCRPFPAELEPALQFELQDPKAMLRILRSMQDSLRPKAAGLWIADQLLRKEFQLKARVYHLAAGGRLLAVIDRVGDVGVLPSSTLAELQEASWIPRPSSAKFIPDSFASATFSVVMWQYATRASRALLPPRYRAETIHYRRPPKVPQKFLLDEHLIVMRQLSVTSSTFSDLQVRCSISAALLEHVLAAMYLVGAITTDPRRARSDFVSGASSFLPRNTSDGASLESASGAHDFTVPGYLPRED